MIRRLLVLGLGSALILAVAACARPVETAAWVVRHELSSPESLERVCAEAKAAELDTLVVQVRGRGDAYYPSRLAPRAEALSATAGNFDPLAEVIRACDGTRVLAWMNVFFLWEGSTPPENPIHPVLARPEWLLWDADGRQVSSYSSADRALGWIEGEYADPGSAGYRQHFSELVREVVETYPVAGVHLDFVRYPGPGYGQTGALGRFFTDAWGLDPRWIPEDLRTPDWDRWLAGDAPLADRVLATASLLWADLRAAQVSALVRAAREALDAVNPNLDLSAAVFPDAGSAYLEKGQDWRTWAAQGYVDALFPMAYFGGSSRVESQLASVVSLVRGAAPAVTLWAGLGGYIKEPDEIAREARAARDLGYEGICLFDAGTLIRRSPGLRSYASVATGKRRSSHPGETPTRAQPRTQGGRLLAALLDRAAGGGSPHPGEAGGALDERWAEFERARRGAIPGALLALHTGTHPIPAWVDASGIFRYVHPLDSGAQRSAQWKTCDEARRRVLSGEDFGKVAAELSQGGTRKLGGVLGRRYLRSESTPDQILGALRAGEVSPVIEVSNGCWIYRVDATGEETALSIDEAPWPVRRILFRRALSEQLRGPDASAVGLPRREAGADT